VLADGRGNRASMEMERQEEPALRLRRQGCLAPCIARQQHLAPARRAKRVKAAAALMAAAALSRYSVLWKKTGC
jgi:hypothetical protein